MLNIGGQYNSSFINSYISGMNQKYNYAAANTRKLEGIMSNRKSLEVRLSKEFTDFRANSKAFYGDFYPKMNDLKSAASKLKTTTLDSVIAPTGPGSNNAKAVNNVSGTVDAPVTIDVQQSATGAKVDFSALVSEGKGDLAGKSQISLKVGGETKKIDLNISDKLSNKDALSEIVTQINNAKTGATASVVQKDGKSMLQIQSDTTGEKSTISAEVQGAMKVAMGGTSATAGQNAVYKIGDVTKTSESNRINVEVGKSNFSATLTGAGTAVISKKQVDSSMVLSAVKDFAKAYNDTVDVLNKSAGKSRNVANLATSFRDVRFTASALDTIGINVDGAGKISVNETKFTEMFAKDPTKVQKLVGSSGGLAGNTYQKASAALISSTTLMQPTNPRIYGKFYGSPVGALMDMFA